MRLYHYRLSLVWLAFLWLTACSLPQREQRLLTVAIQADGQTSSVQLAAGGSVQDALAAANLSLGPLDRCEPPLYTLLTDQMNIRIVRVREEFDVKTVVVPFEQRMIPSESLAEGESLLSQVGVNGTQEVTYRRRFEDNEEVSYEEIKRVTVADAVPEVIVVGIQQMFSPTSLPGRLVYLLGGNAWVMEGNTGKRRLAVTGGDLDGYIFSLSSDGSWLLFTRRATEAGQINTLWAARLDISPVTLVNLNVRNVIYFADWLPGSNTVLAYSTVEPQAAPPGWRTNNDLKLLTLTNGKPGQPKPVDLDQSLVGIYPWWGLSYAWSPDGTQLAYANDHQVGVLTLGDKVQVTPRLEFTYLKTGSDWAWVPGVAWGADGKVLYAVAHAPQPGLASLEESSVFDLAAVQLEAGISIHLVSQVGMFAYPSPSPKHTLPSGEQAYQVAYLQAINALQSKDSHYRLCLMGRDGSGQRVLFPPQGARGLEPQRVVWSSSAVDEHGNYVMAVVYQGNIWFINAADGTARQLTGDGWTVRLDWR